MARVFLFSDTYFGRVENVRDLGFGESIAGRRCLQFWNFRRVGNGDGLMEMLRREKKLE